MRIGAGSHVEQRRVLPREARGAEGAARALSRHGLQPRAERQRQPRRLARHSDDRLARAAALGHAHAGRARAAQVPDAGPAAHPDAGPRVSLAHPLRPAPPDGPARGPAAVRPSSQARADARLRGRELHARRRAAHAALLPHGHGAQPLERDAAAALRGSDPARQERAAGAARPALPEPQRLPRGQPTIRSSRASRRRCSRSSCCSSRTSTYAASTRARSRSSSSTCGSSTRSFARTRAIIGCSSTSCARRKASRAR